MNQAQAEELKKEIDSVPAFMDPQSSREDRSEANSY